MNNKKIFAIPATWMMIGTYFVEAESEEAAREMVMDKELPVGMYVDDSFELTDDEAAVFENEQDLRESGMMEEEDFIIRESDSEESEV